MREAKKMKDKEIVNSKERYIPNHTCLSYTHTLDKY